MGLGQVLILFGFIKPGNNLSLISVLYHIIHIFRHCAPLTLYKVVFFFEALENEKLRT